MRKLQEVREKVIEAVPDTQESVGGVKVQLRSITLADVLRAIDTNAFGLQKSVANEGKFVWFLMRDEATGVRWNLALPLDEQDEEVINFLHKIFV